MSLKNVTKDQEKNMATLEIAIPKKNFEDAVNAVYRRNVGKINVPGFRKGKAPRAIIEKMYGKGVFYEDALNNILPEFVSAAVEESKLDVVSRPEIEVGEINDEGVVVNAKYHLKPVVELGEYKGLEADKIVKEVKDEEVDQAISMDRERGARMVETDAAAQNGDFATIDYLGSVNGVPFDGGKDEGYKLELGSGSFIPGFEEQVIGHKAGEEFDINVKFPEEYHSEDLKGKDAVFAIKLHKVEKKELPALDDDFAKDVSEFDTFAEYKASVKANIEKRNENAAKAFVENQLIDKLVEDMKADIPECMFEDETETMLEDYSYRMQAQGLSLDMYLKYTGMTIDTLKAEFKPQAEKAVKTRLAVEKVAELENIEVAEADIEAEYTKLAESYHQSVEKIKETIKAELITKDIKSMKAVEFLIANAKITEKTEEQLAAEKESADKKEEKKPAKKTTAKKTTAKKADAEKSEDTAEKKPAKKTTTKKTAAKKTEESAE